MSDPNDADPANEDSDAEDPVDWFRKFAEGSSGWDDSLWPIVSPLSSSLTPSKDNAEADLPGDIHDDAELRDEVMRIKGTIPHLATRADFERFKVWIQGGVIGGLVIFLGFAITVIVFLLEILTSGS